MATRKDCMDQVKADLLDSLMEGMTADYVALDVLYLLRQVAEMHEEVPEAHTSRCLPYSEVQWGCGIGWIENSCVDEEDPEARLIVEIMPCIWMNGSVFDGENEPYEIERYDGTNLGYNRAGCGFRLWSDGAEPTAEEREAVKWDG